MRKTLFFSDLKQLSQLSSKMLALLVTGCFLANTACTHTEETNAENDTAVVTETDNTTADNNQKNTGNEDSENVAGPSETDQVHWNNLDFNIMQDRYDEVDDKDITVGSNQQVAVYSINEPLLFDKEGDQLRSGAEQKLKQIAASIAQRYPNAQVRVYGHGGQEGDNKELAQKRAHAVHKWLTTNGNIAENRVSMHADGDKQPTLKGATRTDRKVSVVVYRGGSTGELNADPGSPNNRQSDASNETQGKH